MVDGRSWRWCVQVGSALAARWWRDRRVADPAMKEIRCGSDQPSQRRTPDFNAERAESLAGHAEWIAATRLMRLSPGWSLTAEPLYRGNDRLSRRMRTCRTKG